jgi:Zn finger protein HypA/HybF involved in hydrogenase expression
VPATARCLDCGETFVIRTDDLRCPACRSDKLKPLSGQDMTIAEIEVLDREDPAE